MMHRAVVIYKSKTGFTKKYAEWISEALKCDIKENSKLSLDDVAQYDTIICGGGLYAIGINGIGFIKDNFEALKEKNLIVYATGVTPPRDEDLNKIWESNFSEEQRSKIHAFYFRGGFDFSKLGTGNKIVMSMMKVKLKNDKSPSEDAVGMLNAIDNPVDFTDIKNIQPLVALVNEESHE